jgi:hypothetical protein
MIYMVTGFAVHGYRRTMRRETNGTRIFVCPVPDPRCPNKRLNFNRLSQRAGLVITFDGKRRPVRLKRATPPSGRPVEAFLFFYAGDAADPLFIDFSAIIVHIFTV